MLSPQNAEVTKDSAVLTPLDATGSTATPAPASDLLQAGSSSSALSQSQTSTSAEPNVLVSSDAYASQATGTAQATGATQDIGAVDTSDDGDVVTSPSDQSISFELELIQYKKMLVLDEIPYQELLKVNPVAKQLDQLLQALSSLGKGRMPTTEQLDAFTNKYCWAKSIMISCLLLLHKSEGKINFLDLVPGSGFSSKDWTLVLGKLQALEIISIHSNFARFYALESSESYLKTPVHSDEQMKICKVMYPDAHTDEHILSREEEFAFCILKGEKAIPLVDYVEVVSALCENVKQLQELLIMLYLSGKLRIRNDVLYFLPKR